MDRAIVLCVLLLVCATWLLYRLTVLLEPRNGNPPASKHSDTNSQSPAPGSGKHRQRLIHERLRQ